MADNNSQTTNDTETKAPNLYWVAIKGAAVPHCSLPMSETDMKEAKVRVGESPDEPTMWGIKGWRNLPDTPIMHSNYDALIGYKTQEEQLTAVGKFLHESGSVALAAFLQATMDDTIIWGSDKIKKRWNAFMRSPKLNPKCPLFDLS